MYSVCVSFFQHYWSSCSCCYCRHSYDYVADCVECMFLENLSETIKKHENIMFSHFVLNLYELLVIVEKCFFFYLFLLYNVVVFICFCCYWYLKIWSACGMLGAMTKLNNLMFICMYYNKISNGLYERIRVTQLSP